MNKTMIRMFSLLLCLAVLTGCAAKGAAEGYTNKTGMNTYFMGAEAKALSSTFSLSVGFPDTEAPGTKTQKNNKAVIDYSNIADGYVMARYTAPTEKKLKAQVAGPTTTYTYNLTSGEWAAFPLSDGNGSYKVTVFENVSGTKYSTVLSTSFTLKLEDEFAPFLRPNQYVNYSEAEDTITKGLELTEGLEDPLEKVAAVYDFVVENFEYD